MSFFSLIYDKVMSATEAACLREWRRELLMDVQGRVLEIGAGTGASLPLYPQRADLELFLAEPEPGMRKQLTQRAQASGHANITILACTAEQIDANDQSFDVVFVSLVCCSVNDIGQTLSEIRRVLKPDGRFIFLEHVAAEPGSARRKWQNGMNFLWKRVAGNCHLNRETERLIQSAGFDIQSLQRDSLRKAMPLVRPSIRGWAVPGQGIGARS